MLMQRHFYIFILQLIVKSLLAPFRWNSQDLSSPLWGSGASDATLGKLFNLYGF